MNVEIRDRVRQAGLEGAVQKASELFPKIIPRSLQPLVEVTWEVLRTFSDSVWILVELQYDGRVAEHAVFEPKMLNDAEYMRERLEWLWSRVLRTRLLQRVDEPLDKVEEPAIQVANG